MSFSETDTGLGKRQKAPPGSSGTLRTLLRAEFEGTARDRSRPEFLRAAGLGKGVVGEGGLRFHSSRRLEGPGDGKRGAESRGAVTGHLYEFSCPGSEKPKPEGSKSHPTPHSPTSNALRAWRGGTARPAAETLPSRGLCSPDEPETGACSIYCLVVAGLVAFKRHAGATVSTDGAGLAQLGRGRRVLGKGCWSLAEDGVWEGGSPGLGLVECECVRWGTGWLAPFAVAKNWLARGVGGGHLSPGL